MRRFCHIERLFFLLIQMLDIAMVMVRLIVRSTKIVFPLTPSKYVKTLLKIVCTQCSVVFSVIMFSNSSH